MRRFRWPALAALLLALLAAPLPARALGGWSPAAPMLGQHTFGRAVALNDGRVLVIGGQNTAATEIYDPRADRWTAAGDIENSSGAAVLLGDGSVLASGGRPLLSPHGVFASALRFFPASNSWQPAAPMLRPRAGHTLTLLRDGRVLAAGGVDQIAATGIRTNSTEIYDPARDSWAEGPPMHTPRASHTATFLADGRFLFVGGDEGGAEIYDPASNSWQDAAPPARARQAHTATWLPNNTVLLVGDGSAEIYDPASNRWRDAGPMLTPRTGAEHSATLLPGGQVLVAGGWQQTAGGAELAILAAAELYDWQLDRWLPAAPLSAPRAGHIAIVLPSFALLVAGGYSDGGRGPLPGGANGVHLASAERYAESAAPEQCFAETGFCVSGPFLRYWQAHGGLPINGYPISNEFAEVLEDGNAYIVQYFERVRMEYHANNAPPYDILLGQFGRRIHPADPPAAPIAGARYFGETGHNLRGGFLRYWERNGGLAQFGYPLSETFAEALEDGNTYTVQYFERARFEYHPENRPPYDILLGQFGRRILRER
ncbi:Kelch repeat-containing protein [Kouleothrix sp.]|uniref:Kelch repeat-containing protein n=1 Tax=Kouleothrix sp. TaxID=2779161 RepID=UPI00391A83F1